MKIDRLIAILNYLLCHGKTSAQKLSEEFEVSVRTIVRDIETLGQAGFPIQSSCGSDGGYRIMETYVVDKRMMSDYDYQHIIAALDGLLSAYPNKQVEQTMNKFVTQNQPRESIVKLDLSIANEKANINKYISILEEAIKKHRLVTFQYTNNENITKKFEVEPVRIEYKWYHWYLIAYLAKYEDYGMFKLIRMEGLEVLERECTISDHTSEITLKDNRKTIDIKLYGDKMIKAKCKEYLNGRIIKEYENGDFEYQFTVPENESFWYGVILSFGNKVKVLEPKSVIERILQTCDEIEIHYEKNHSE